MHFPSIAVFLLFLAGLRAMARRLPVVTCMPAAQPDRTASRGRRPRAVGIDIVTAEAATAITRVASNVRVVVLEALYILGMLFHMQRRNVGCAGS